MMVLHLTRHPPEQWPYLWLDCDPRAMVQGAILRITVVPMLFPQAWPIVGMRGELLVRGVSDAGIDFSFVPVGGRAFDATGTTASNDGRSNQQQEAV